MLLKQYRGKTKRTTNDEHARYVVGKKSTADELTCHDLQGRFRWWDDLAASLSGREPLQVVEDRGKQSGRRRVSALATSCAKNEYENELTRRGSINTLDSLTGRGDGSGGYVSTVNGRSSRTSCGIVAASSGRSELWEREVISSDSIQGCGESCERTLW